MGRCNFSRFRVTGIVGRADVLACIFFLVSLLAYHGGMLLTESRSFPSDPDDDDDEQEKLLYKKSQEGMNLRRQEDKKTRRQEDKKTRRQEDKKTRRQEDKKTRRQEDKKTRRQEGKNTRRQEDNKTTRQSLKSQFHFLQQQRIREGPQLGLLARTTDDSTEPCRFASCRAYYEFSAISWQQTTTSRKKKTQRNLSKKAPPNQPL
ncbi:conserved hypothetical protein [Culex quinquefasciatus]|uniref:Uncharacterized protein n=1 Tax=Culex quinquefasciatus TaxID=7176 RepID=B0WXJ3_CULQU|nr:conserved hypothetical protein [Culex quinquefasciatus]|eukprot:XP_001862115.1 conserved hypothetical protein [Culex quinquefasciatus]